jgi:hypothetical protein
MAQAAIGYQAVLLSQKLLNPGKLQPIMLKPLLNLLSPWPKHLVGGYCRLARPGSVQLQQGSQL